MRHSRKGRPIDGWIVIDKPLQLTSAAAVAAVRRITGAAKAGHGGTLDPLATGVLPIALGEATKAMSQVMDGAKSYRFRIAWGEARSTGDSEGEVTATSEVRPDAEAIIAVLPRFLGEIEQVPPAFSAIKLGGRRAYDLAREGQTVALAPRRVRIDRLVLVEADGDGATFEVDCGKGTYVRALATDIAAALGTVGHVAALRRTRSGPFLESQAISLDKLAEFVHIAAPASFVLPVATVLDDIPALALTEDEARRLRNGQTVPMSLAGGPANAPLPPSGTTVRAMEAERLVALARIEDGRIRPVRVFNL